MANNADARQENAAMHIIFSVRRVLIASNQNSRSIYTACAIRRSSHRLTAADIGHVDPQEMDLAQPKGDAAQPRRITVSAY